MAAASVCSTAIYQGTDQGGVWMKQHEVTKCNIGSRIRVKGWNMDFIDLFYVTFHIKSNAALIILHVKPLSSPVLLSSQSISLHSKEKSVPQSPRL